VIYAIQLRNKVRGGRAVGNAYHVVAKAHALASGETVAIFDDRAPAEAHAAKLAGPESPPAPTVTGRTPSTCSARGFACNSNPCFGCPNA
jgi:hypothetical protein